MPPTVLCEPDGVIVPSTRRFFTVPPRSSLPNRARRDSPDVSSKRRMVCPFPSNVPKKMGMYTAVPSRSISSVKIAVSPLE